MKKQNHYILGEGTQYFPIFWDKPEQISILQHIRELLKIAPWFDPTMPLTGKSWSIKMSNAGTLGWVSDRKGYRYQAHHPITQAAWPPIPEILITAWQRLTHYPAPPEVCLINYYHHAAAKMGLHQDRDEVALDAPIVSFSLGDSALFRMGGTRRQGKTRSLKLHSGDAFVFGGAARLNFHGLDRIYYGSSQLLSADTGFPDGGRLNLTLRRVNVASTERSEIS